jgi:membrane-associated phospholipid phosphatase
VFCKISLIAFGSIVLEIVSRLNAEEVGAYFGQHAVLVFSLILAGLLVASISLRSLLQQLQNVVYRFAPADGQHAPSSTVLSFRDRFFRPFTQRANPLLPDGRPGLYLTASLFVLAITGASFLLLAFEVSQQDWLVRFDHSLSASLHEHSTVDAVWIFQLVSDFGDPSTLTSISLLFLVVLAVTRHWRLFCLWTITLPGAGILNQFLKETLQRERPQLPNPWIAESGWSFPSGHAMCSLVIYGLLAYSICFLPTSHRLRLSFGFLTILLVFAIGVSRLYLGVHYFSDVMAGYLAATFWLILCITGDQAARCLRTLEKAVLPWATSSRSGSRDVASPFRPLQSSLRAEPPSDSGSHDP